MRRLVVRGGRVFTGGDLVEADVALLGSEILRVGDVEAAEGDDVLDAAGCLVLPGLVDLHVHLREPGDEEAETVATGSAAGALGGFTDVVAMPNTDPPTDTAAAAEAVAAAGRAAGLVRVHPAGCVTAGRAGERLAPMRELQAAGVRIFTDDGACVADPLVMRRALEYAGALGCVLAQHCEEPALTRGAQMHEGEVSGRLGLAGWPAAAEEAVVARDVILAETTGARLHIQHLSSGGSVRILRDAKARGVAVTAEVTPHHLVLTDAACTGYDPAFKVNPPLRSAVDTAALLEGLADGTIDVVATDHAPHTPENKEEWVAARPGMLGLETALAVLWGFAADGRLTLARLVDAMATRPAQVLGLSPRGGVVEGGGGDLCVLDPEVRWTVAPAALASRASNTPFAGRELTGRVRHTVLAGRPVVRGGDVVSQAVGV